MKKGDYDIRAKKLVADIRKLIDAKGLDLSVALKDVGFSRKDIDNVLSGDKIPTLDEFLALCEISGINLQFPYVETPKNPM